MCIRDRYIYIYLIITLFVSSFGIIYCHNQNWCTDNREKSNTTRSTNLDNVCVRVRARALRGRELRQFVVYISKIIAKIAKAGKYIRTKFLIYSPIVLLKCKDKIIIL